MNRIEIRQAGVEHILEIAKLGREIWTEHYTPLIGRQQVEYMLDNFQSEDALSKQISKEGYIYYIAYDNYKACAYFGVQPNLDTKDLFISKAYVEKNYRNKGIFRNFINIAIDLCKEYKLNKMWLTVNKNNKNSIEAYKKLGFIIEDAMVTDIGGGFVMDDYKMSRQI